jgi:uncharacterized protein YggE
MPSNVTQQLRINKVLVFSGERITMKSVCIFFATLLLAGMAVAQTSSATATVLVNTIYAGADGKFESAPDTAVLRLDVAAQQDTSRAAYDKAAAAAESVRQVLRANGIDPKAAQVGFYQVQPIYDWKNPKHKVIAFRVVTNVTLKLHDFSKIGALTDQMADIEDTQNQSLSYILEDIEQAKSRASEDALKKARNQANAVATAGGRTLGELLYAAVDAYGPPIVALPMMQQRSMVGASAAQAAPTAEFTPQTVTTSAHVNAMFALK